MAARPADPKADYGTSQATPAWAGAATAATATCNSSVGFVDSATAVTCSSSPLPPSSLMLSISLLLLLLLLLSTESVTAGRAGAAPPPPPE